MNMHQIWVTCKPIFITNWPFFLGKKKNDYFFNISETMDIRL